MAKKRLERLCNSCRCTFKYLPSSTKGHPPKTKCPNCDTERARNIRETKEGLREKKEKKEKKEKRQKLDIGDQGFGCMTIEETNKRIAARASARQKARFAAMVARDDVAVVQ